MKNAIQHGSRYSTATLVGCLLCVIWVVSGCSADDTNSGAGTATISLSKPELIAHPSSQTLAEGTTALLTVVATAPDGATLSYQWQKAGKGSTSFTDVAGATRASYTTPMLSASDSGVQYRVVVTAKHSSGKTSSVTSRVATLTVLAIPPLDAPTLTVHPASQTIAAGDTARLVVVATAPAGATLSYQWQRAGKGTEDFMEVVGATCASYTTPVLSSADSGVQYRVEVMARHSSGLTSSVTSGVATLTVLVVPKIVWTDSKGIRRYAAVPANGVLLSAVLSASKADIISVDSIPSGVTRIGDSAFMGCAGLVSITIPSSVGSMGRYAFSGCTSLVNVRVEATTPPSIGNNMFVSNPFIVRIRVPDERVAAYRSATNWNLYAHRIYGYHEATQIVWTDSKGTTRYADIPADGVIVSAVLTTARADIQSVDTIPSGVTSIGDTAFKDCTGLVSIRLPSGITSVGAFAFYKCSSLVSIAIPSSVSNVGNGAFWYCTSLRSATLSAGMASIGEYTFSACSSLTGITLPNSVTRIGAYAFSACSSLTSITLPSSLTSIGESAFEGCIGLTGITLPSSLTSIGGLAFYMCSSLTSITLPSSVTSIAFAVFADCIRLASVRVEGTTPPSLGLNAFTSTAFSFLISVPDGSVSAYRGATNWSEYAPIIYGFNDVVVPKIVWTDSKGIRQYAAVPTDGALGSSVLTSTETDIKSVDYIPSSVTSIKHLAFRDCTRLTGITLPTSVTDIGIMAFRGCTALTNIYIPSGVTSMDTAVFKGCTALTSVRISYNIARIGTGVFRGCSSLASVKIEATTPPDMGSEVFAGTPAHLSITVPRASVAAYQGAASWSSYFSKVTGY